MVGPMRPAKKFLAAAFSSDSRGFALLTVLFSLAIISGLAALATAQIASYAKARALQVSSQHQASVVRSSMHVAAAYAQDLQQEGGDTIIKEEAFRFGGSTYRISVIDVGGLIDVNTARLDLLREFLARIDPEFEEAIGILEDRRRAEQRFNSVGDFAAMAPFRQRFPARMQRFLTTHSGRSGISPEHAPTRLLQMFSGGSSERSALESSFAAEWRSPPTNRTFKAMVFVAATNQRSVGEGVLSVSSDGSGQVSLLEVSR